MIMSKNDSIYVKNYLAQFVYFFKAKDIWSKKMEKKSIKKKCRLKNVKDSVKKYVILLVKKCLISI